MPCLFTKDCFVWNTLAWGRHDIFIIDLSPSWRNLRCLIVWVLVGRLVGSCKICLSQDILTTSSSELAWGKYHFCIMVLWWKSYWFQGGLTQNKTAKVRSLTLCLEIPSAKSWLCGHGDINLISSCLINFCKSCGKDWSQNWHVRELWPSVPASILLSFSPKCVGEE